MISLCTVVPTTSLSLAVGNEQMAGYGGLGNIALISQVYTYRIDRLLFLWRWQLELAMAILVSISSSSVNLFYEKKFFVKKISLPNI